MFKQVHATILYIHFTHKKKLDQKFVYHVLIDDIYRHFFFYALG